MADVVEYYYRTKKMRCLTPPFKICSFRSNILTPSDLNNVFSREKCANCIQNAFKTNKGKIRRRRFDVCLACEMYMRLLREHRPFTVALRDENTTSSIGKGSSSVVYKKTGLKTPNEKPITTDQRTNATKQQCQPMCYFQPRIEQLNRMEEWADEEILACLKAIQQHGDNWKLVAAELPGRTTLDITQFYSEYQLTYRLDFIIGMATNFENGTSSNTSPNGKTAQNNRLLRTNSSNSNLNGLMLTRSMRGTINEDQKSVPDECKPSQSTKIKGNKSEVALFGNSEKIKNDEINNEKEDSECHMKQIDRLRSCSQENVEKSSDRRSSSNSHYENCSEALIISERTRYQRKQHQQKRSEPSNSVASSETGERSPSLNIYSAHNQPIYLEQRL